MMSETVMEGGFCLEKRPKIIERGVNANNIVVKVKATNDNASSDLTICAVYDRGQVDICTGQSWIAVSSRDPFLQKSKKHILSK